MSAIYGLISLDQKAIPEKITENLKKEYQGFHIDRYQEVQTESAFMGCGIQFFTEESKNESLPIHDNKKQVLFTADCVLDNRSELMTKLGIEEDFISDGRILYEAYLKWGESCSNHLRGLFSYVAYHYDTGKVVLSADHFANRCLFYQIRDNILIFSTLMLPIVKASKWKYHLNNRWLVDSIAVLSPSMMNETRETAYEEIYKVDSGHFVIITKDKNPEYICYFTPIDKIRTNYSMKEDDCRKRLLSLLTTSVTHCMNTSGKVGIQLSSGLDSSTIGCIAAPILEQKKQKLYSFTSVPEKENHMKNSNCYLFDESEGVLKIVKKYSNIEPMFLSSENKNILNCGKEIVDIWELPCQSEQNAVWIHDIFKHASEMGCKIMLSGATGNCTISAGNFVDLFFDSIHRKHPVKAWKDFSHYCKKYGIPRKNVFSQIRKQYKEYKKLSRDVTNFGFEGQSLVSKEQLESVDFENRYVNKYLIIKPWMCIKEYREEIYLPEAYAQIGEIDTKLSLTFGVLPRDPLRNVELIEFFMSLPLEYFVNKNYSRRLVREFMEGIVPEDIRLDVFRRGKQSADNTLRIEKVWDQYKEDIKTTLLSKNRFHFLDEKKIEGILEKLEQEGLQNNELEMRRVLDAYLFSYYVDCLSSDA